jgi:predicted DNA-binding protein
MAKRRGRPPAGPKGQARVTMRQISARLPDETCAQLKALSVVLQTSQADVIARAIAALEQALSETDQRLATLLRKRDP